MPTHFFIIPYEPKEYKTASSDLVIDPDWYRGKLVEKWPIITFSEIKKTDHVVLEWCINNSSLYIHLLYDLQIVSMWGPPLPEFVLWHRSIIPSQHRLYLLGDYTWDSLELTSKTTIEDIENY